ncbi:MAG: TRAP transporter small permease subunit [Alphaproteobacteria bacterium]
MAEFSAWFAGTVDRLNEAIGAAAAWMTTFMVAIQFGIVVMRFAFGENLILVQDMVLYLHGMVFMLGAGYLALRNGHVRVDLIYRDLTERRRHWIDLAGTLLLMLPFATAVLILSLPYALDSWRILEGSRETTGLPLVFLLKTTIPLFAVLLILQGLANAIRLALRLRRRERA